MTQYKNKNIRMLEAKIQVQHKKQTMLQEQIDAFIQERKAFNIKKNFILEVASLKEDNRFHFEKLNSYMNDEILPLKSKLFIALSERDQAFAQANCLEDEL